MNKSICKKLISGLSWLLLAIPLVLILVFAGMKLSGQVPSLFGYSLYVIASPSMTPDLNVGDVILNKEYKADSELQVGDIISYRGSAGELSGKLITHRVVALEEGSEGLLVTTKGTANYTADPQFTEGAIVSVMKCRIPLIGVLYSIIQKPAGFAILFLLPMLYFMAAEIKDLKKTIKNEILSNTEEVDHNEE